jgi:hypothetical protein
VAGRLELKPSSLSASSLASRKVLIDEQGQRPNWNAPSPRPATHPRPRVGTGARRPCSVDTSRLVRPDVALQASRCAASCRRSRRDTHKSSGSSRTNRAGASASSSGSRGRPPPRGPRPRCRSWQPCRLWRTETHGCPSCQGMTSWSVPSARSSNRRQMTGEMSARRTWNSRMSFMVGAIIQRRMRVERPPSTPAASEP